MRTINIEQPINLKVVKFELDFTPLKTESHENIKTRKQITIPSVNYERAKKSAVPPPPAIKNLSQKRNVKELIEDLLEELYADHHDWSTASASFSRGSVSGASFTSSLSNYGDQTVAMERSYLEALSTEEILAQTSEWKARLHAIGERLARKLRARDRLKRQQKKLCDAVNVILHHITGETEARFGITPGGGEGPGEGGFAEWLHAMRLVARLPAGVPQHFRKKLWLTLAERHLTSRHLDWSSAERACFRGTAQPDDTELGAQILKDLHRTGCSLFCGAEGRENQAMLRRVLLAYARWNKDVGYCQGFNMLAAIILEVMDKSESDSLKVMIYLVEAVLPEGYFADDLRGLSADMAAFRDLLRLRLPRLATHMDHLQKISDGGGVEPPLPDVFTMQWFLTLYATWLPRESLLRVWDLVLLDGNEVLLLTALAIWDLLQDRILSARSADEFYSCMGGGAGAVWEAGEALVARVVAFGSAPELPRLRSLHRYRVTPPTPVPNPPLHSTMQSMTKRGLRLFYSEDEGDSSDDGNKMALATVLPRRDNRIGTGDRLSLDIGALKRQYARLRERQRQAHVILAAACARHAAVGVPTSPTSLTVNNLLLGKSAIVSSRGRRLGPPPGAVPPSRQTLSPRENQEKILDRRASDTISWKEAKSRKSLSRRNSVKWKDVKKEKISEKIRKASIDFDEAGDGIIVSELEASQMIASLRSRSSSETSSYSSHTISSTDTSLCDENEKGSDSEPDLSDDDKETGKHKVYVKMISPSDKSLPIEKNTKTVVTDTEQNNVKNIEDYLDSAAGEPLRTYIDGFETKLKQSSVECQDTDKFLPLSLFKNFSPISPDNSHKNEILERLSNTKFEDINKSEESLKPIKFSTIPKNFTELSPLDFTSECIRDTPLESPHNYDFESNFNRASEVTIPSRAPDIIDSLTMHPNFLPDIDLSEKNISDIESPNRSPGAESIIVSEDEPPIPLKIDKYFEHSPEFFGARVTDPNNSEIPNRRAVKRHNRLPKKPDSLTIHCSNHENSIKSEVERASSLPQNQSFSSKKSFSPDITKKMSESDYPHLINETPNDSSLNLVMPLKLGILEKVVTSNYDHLSGRKNSERALQIIQENSKILSRILTKQLATDSNHNASLNTSDSLQTTTNLNEKSPKNSPEAKQLDSLLLRESTSDSLIGYRKNIVSEDLDGRDDFLRVRPISIDDPFSLEVRSTKENDEEFSFKVPYKSPSNECLVNKPDLYGWENKGFLAKCDSKKYTGKSCKYDFAYSEKHGDRPEEHHASKNELIKSVRGSELPHSYSSDSRSSLPDYSYHVTSKHNDFILSKDSELCSRTLNLGPKACEKLSKTDNSQFSDFDQVVTSSISFTYEPSAEDDSPTGVKSNSSDTLCQITSLDQVSTPISPKIFPRETPIFPKENIEKSDKTIVETDDTCSNITSLIETTDTLSSLSYPRSPSSGSYYPFPTKPAMRMPKELGVRLGMYPKDTINSSPK